jgi:aldehyde:ferredoxin oxidoreductase
MVEIGQVETSLGMTVLSRQAGPEKAWNVARHQDWRSLFNSLVLCYFSNISPEMIVALINAACGQEFNLAEIQRLGERGWNLKRAINNRLGLRRENDRLPKALLKPHSPGGGSEGYVPPIIEMLESYYSVRGWDPRSGFPKREKLLELGLDFAADDLEKIKLGMDAGVRRSHD